MSSAKMNLPRVRDWTQGKYQIGIFVRTPNGSTVYLVDDKPTRRIVECAMKAIIANGDEDGGEAGFDIKDEQCFTPSKPNDGGLS
jgi:hypothetical protein